MIQGKETYEEPIEPSLAKKMESALNLMLTKQAESAAEPSNRESLPIADLQVSEVLSKAKELTSAGPSLELTDTIDSQAK